MFVNPFPLNNLTTRRMTWCVFLSPLPKTHLHNNNTLTREAILPLQQSQGQPTISHAIRKMVVKMGSGRVCTFILGRPITTPLAHWWMTGKTQRSEGEGIELIHLYHESTLSIVSTFRPKQIQARIFRSGVEKSPLGTIFCTLCRFGHPNTNDCIQLDPLTNSW